MVHNRLSHRKRRREKFSLKNTGNKKNMHENTWKRDELNAFITGNPLWEQIHLNLV